MLLDTGSGCASPHSIDGVAFGVGTWSISRISTVQVGQKVLDRYSVSTSSDEDGNASPQLDLADLDVLELDDNDGDDFDT